MSQHTQLQASDGHKFDAYIAQPSGEPKAGVVVLQEIFGVNAHIRSVADRFARAGYLAIAPALFDRAQRGVELAYEPEEGKQGMQLVQRIPLDQTLADIAAAIQYLREHGARKVGVVGFCWVEHSPGSATRSHPDATVSYYPGGIQHFIHERFSAPAIFHFGLDDNHIPQTVVEEVRNDIRLPSLRMQAPVTRSIAMETPAITRPLRNWRSSVPSRISTSPSSPLTELQHFDAPHLVLEMWDW